MVAGLGLGRGLVLPRSAQAPWRSSARPAHGSQALVDPADVATTPKDLLDDSRAAHEATLPPPWKRTIAKDSDSPLLYGDFYKWQLELLQSSALEATPLELRGDLALQVNEKKGARVGSACFESPLFRKVRMTYFDAGAGVQVFNSLWYPRFERDAPVLGIDLLCFGGTKVLAVVDCQPLGGRDELRSQAKVDGWAEEGEANPNPFKRIRDQYPSLCGTMSNRYYDANQFFSDAMLFGRFEAPGQAALERGEPHPIDTDLFPAFKEYVCAYVDLVANTLADPSSASRVQERQRAYDQYSADRDPAHALFKGYFGAQWADSLMHELLFDLSDPELTRLAHEEMTRAQKEAAKVGGGGNPFA